MKYISSSKLIFFFETYYRNAIYELNSAQLQGHFKEENYYMGKIDLLEKLSSDLNLKLHIDKL